MHSSTCPLVALAAQGRGSSSAASRPAPSTPVASADVLALRRFYAMLDVASTVLAPFLAQVLAFSSIYAFYYFII
jgi:hypothetical protein